MIWSLYKKYFSVDIDYETDESVLSSNNILLLPSSSTINLLNNHQMGYRTYDGGILIFFQGTENKTDSGKIIPQYTINNDESLYFKLYFTDSSLVSKLNMFPETSTIPQEFPHVYLGERKDSSSTIELTYQNNKIVPAIFSYPVKDTDCGLTASTKTNWVIKNQHGSIIQETDTNKTETGIFECSVQLTNQPIGMYTLEIGSHHVSFLVDTTGEFQGCTAIIRIIKNSFLPFETNWLNTNYIKFSKTYTKKTT